MTHIASLLLTTAPGAMLPGMPAASPGGSASPVDFLTLLLPGVSPDAGATALPSAARQDVAALPGSGLPLTGADALDGDQALAWLADATGVAVPPAPEPVVTSVTTPGTGPTPPIVTKHAGTVLRDTKLVDRLPRLEGRTATPTTTPAEMEDSDPAVSTPTDAAPTIPDGTTPAMMPAGETANMTSLLAAAQPLATAPQQETPAGDVATGVAAAADRRPAPPPAVARHEDTVAPSTGDTAPPAEEPATMAPPPPRAGVTQAAPSGSGSAPRTVSTAPDASGTNPAVDVPRPDSAPLPRTAASTATPAPAATAILTATPAPTPTPPRREAVRATAPAATDNMIAPASVVQTPDTPAPVREATATVPPAPLREAIPQDVTAPAHQATVTVSSVPARQAIRQDASEAVTPVSPAPVRETVERAVIVPMAEATAPSIVEAITRGAPPSPPAAIAQTAPTPLPDSPPRPTAAGAATLPAPATAAPPVIATTAPVRADAPIVLPASPPQPPVATATATAATLPIATPPPAPPADTAPPATEAPRTDAPVAARPIAPAAAEPSPAAPVIASAARTFAEAIHRAVTADDRPRAADPAASAASAVTTGAVTTAAVTATGQAQQQTLDMRQPHWPSAMIQHIEKLRDMADANDMRIRVVPDALGAIDVSLRRDGDTVQVQLVAEQPQTRAMLAEAQPRLTEMAEARGLKLQHGTATGGNTAQQNTDRQPQQQPQRGTPVPHAPPSARRAAADADDIDQRLA